MSKNENLNATIKFIDKENLDATIKFIDIVRKIKPSNDDEFINGKLFSINSHFEKSSEPLVVIADEFISSRLISFYSEYFSIVGLATDNHSCIVDENLIGLIQSAQSRGIELFLIFEKEYIENIHQKQKDNYLTIMSNVKNILTIEK